MESDSNRVKIAQVKSVLKRQTDSFKVEQILHNLNDVLIIDAQTDPLIQRELLTILIRTLKTLEFSEEQAITSIRAITSNEAVLSILDENPETSISQN